VCDNAGRREKGEAGMRSGYRGRSRYRRRRPWWQRRSNIKLGIALAVIGGLWIAQHVSSLKLPTLPALRLPFAAEPTSPRVQPSTQAASAYFSLCGPSGGDNCVIDGDTFHFRGEKIRIADIDAPETPAAMRA
jgi:endonuclease YncB( thermonuclease family)